MPKFIKTHPKYPATDDSVFHINVDKIESVILYEGLARIVVTGSYENFSFYDVKETVEEVMEMING